MVNNKIVLELSKYMYEGFELIRKHGTLEDVQMFIEKEFNSIVYIKEEGCLVGMAIYMMISDVMLEGIVSKETDIFNKDRFDAAKKIGGDNLHIYALRAERVEVILRGLRRIMKNVKCKTISWYSVDTRRIAVIRGR